MTTPMASAPEHLNVLRRMLARPPRSGGTTDRCHLCSAGVPERHRHLFDEKDGNVLCACQACTILFERDGAGRGHYRLIPNRRLKLSGLSVAGLRVPVGLAFFVARSDGLVTAHYPSPLGTTTCDVDPDSWRMVQRDSAEIRHLRPNVEALLVNTSRGAHEHWIVPIDDCYRLVAVIRQNWRGMSGGTEVWPAIDRFFTDLGMTRSGAGQATTPLERGNDV